MNAPAHSPDSPTPPRTFCEALELAAATRAEPALWDGGHWRTWRDCLRQAERTAGALHRRGFTTGDVLAAQLPNSWELVVLHAATARLGVLLLPLHSAYGTRETQALIEQSGASGLAIRAFHRGHDRTGEIVTLSERCPSLRHLWVSTAGAPTDPRRPAGGLPELAELFDPPAAPTPQSAQSPQTPQSARTTPPDRLPPPPADPRTPLLLLASSGTTSARPKLCVHSHAGLLGNAAAVAADGGFGAGDTIVSASPLSHAFGMLSVHLALVTGGAVGLFDGWDAHRFARALAATSATTAFAVPAQLRDLLALPAEATTAPPTEATAPPTEATAPPAEAVGITAEATAPPAEATTIPPAEATAPPAPRLREVRTGGAPVPRELADAVRRRLGARLVVQWGMTEVGAGTYTRPDDPPGATATIGRPASGARVRVLAPDGGPAAEGATGELQYRSPYMFDGYYRAPERTAAALTPDGWLRTGDLAALGPDGSVHYRGRADELLNRGGLKFSALEVEELLDDLPQLAQHAVVGRPDPRLGQRSCLLAALRGGTHLTLEDVTGHLIRKGLATYKLPEQLVLVDRLPTTVTGKIARARLHTIPLPPLPEPPRRGASRPVPETAR
ncbi:class I adenylate-forming enzyme family protein [Streptomyces sp. NPDC018347]|uniref:class I adenylate-forming enzyme family protein n=1 Tax=Streptomyces sp. NPDC018347 TaxID=3157193 RepID=UPI0033D5C73D